MLAALIVVIVIVCIALMYKKFYAGAESFSGIFDAKRPAVSDAALTEGLLRSRWLLYIKPDCADCVKQVANVDYPRSAIMYCSDLDICAYDGVTTFPSWKQNVKGSSVVAGLQSRAALVQMAGLGK